MADAVGLWIIVCFCVTSVNMKDTEIPFGDIRKQIEITIGIRQGLQDQ